MEMTEVCENVFQLPIFLAYGPDYANEKMLEVHA